jgi:hypothetical protein
MPLEGAAMSAAREVQVPILALLLIGACAAKTRYAVRTRSIGPAISPLVMLPLRLRSPTSFALCAAELGLGVCLLVTAGQAGAGTPAACVRVLTALLFAVGAAALNEMRISRPGAGCGCFGDLSDAPVGRRSLARSALLCAGAIASVGGPPLQLPSSVGRALLLAIAASLELLLVAAISPEVGQIMVRLGCPQACEERRLPVSRSLASLCESKAWRHYRPFLTALTPNDVWREGCWRFVAYPAAIHDHRVDIVFSVYVQGRRPPVRAAVVAADSALPAFPPAPTGRAVPGAAAAASSGPAGAAAPQPQTPSGGTTPRAPRGIPDKPASLSDLLIPPGGRPPVPPGASPISRRAYRTC